ncbi:MAG: carboxypeptidase-like regulatory domain-containing protein, partial [Terriglobales bacterium]
MSKKLFLSFALLVVLLCLSTLALSQVSSESSVKGNLSGAVSDPTGAVVQGAKVTLSGPFGENRMETDSSGRFLFQVLTPGFYSVKITKEGFKTAEIKSAEVVTGRTTAVGVTMELGTSATVVEVVAG